MMRILIDSGTYDCRNMGDVAMLQIAVERLRGLWPSAQIGVMTADAVELGRHCPGVAAVDHLARQAWFNSTIPTGPFRRLMSPASRKALDRAAASVRDAFPDAYRIGLSAWHRAARGIAQSDGVDGFLATVRSTDLFVACGQGTLTDAGKEQSTHLLGTARLAAKSGAQTVFVGQGIGPLSDVELRRLSRRVLSSAGLITLRERLLGPAILTELGIPSSQWMNTGDEAVELAYRMRTPTVGQAIGIHVRRAPLAPMQADAFEAIRDTLVRCATGFGAELLPVPISQHETGTNDARTIAELLRDQSPESDGGRTLNTPSALIAQVARCRLVVTGAYHAAVFALSQGIPVICLGGSEYYLNKFSGLIDLFPGGCQAIRFDQPGLSVELEAAIGRAWRSADAVRTPLRSSAAQQIAWGHAAYDRIRGLVAASAPAKAGTISMSPTAN